MAMPVSGLYGLDMYSNEAKYIGKVNDIILNLETGKIVRLTTEPLRSVSREKAREVLKGNSVLYKNVTAVADIVIVGRKGRGGVAAEEVEETPKRRDLAKRRSLLGRTK